MQRIGRNRNELPRSERSEMYLDSAEAKNRQFKIFGAVSLISIIFLLILYKIGLFTRKPSSPYIAGSVTQKIEESTNTLLSAWGQAGEALKFANLPSTGQGYLSVKSMVIQQDGSEKEQNINIFYREASKLNPMGWGIANKIVGLHQDLFKKSMSALTKNDARFNGKKSDENMDDFVINKDVTLIFLHGVHYASSTWSELGTLEYFANLGYKIYGIDMPGFGHSDKVSVKSNDWLIDVIQKLILSQDEEGNLDQDGGEHKHNKKKDKNVVHKIAIISPDVSIKYTLDLLNNQKEKFKDILLTKYIPISIDDQLIADFKFNEESNEVQICNIEGSNDVDLDKKIFENVKNAQTVIITGAAKHVYLDKPNTFHRIISTFLKSGKCELPSV